MEGLRGRTSESCELLRVRLALRTGAGEVVEHLDLGLTEVGPGQELDGLARARELSRDGEGSEARAFREGDGDVQRVGTVDRLFERSARRPFPVVEELDLHRLLGSHMQGIRRTQWSEGALAARTHLRSSASPRRLVRPGLADAADTGQDALLPKPHDPPLDSNEQRQR